MFLCSCDFRPIIILSLLSKAMERIRYDKFWNTQTFLNCILMN